MESYRIIWNHTQNHTESYGIIQGSCGDHTWNPTEPCTALCRDHMGIIHRIVQNHTRHCTGIAWGSYGDHTQNCTEPYTVLYRDRMGIIHGIVLPLTHFPLKKHKRKLKL